jgi:S1-C subfamily serine protease
MSNFLSTLSNELAATVESAAAAVVRVEGRRRLAASGMVWADGVVVTAHHVLQNEEGLQVGLPNGQTAAASLVGRDATTDLAVLRVDAPGAGWQAATRATTQTQVGHLVLAVGRPGHTPQATLGIVSAVSQQPWRTPAGGELDHYLQTDVVMFPGFSGGPLVNAAGEVVGLNTSALLRGVSLTVPHATMSRVVDALLAHGRVRRGYLGLSTQPVRLPAAVAQTAGQETGLLLVSVEPNSPADHAGLLLGDTILTFDGAPVRHHDDLLAQLGSRRVGQQAQVRLLRGGQVQDLTVLVGEKS